MLAGIGASPPVVVLPRATAPCWRAFKQQSCQGEAGLAAFRQAVRFARSFRRPPWCAGSGGTDLSEAPETSGRACPKYRTIGRRDLRGASCADPAARYAHRNGAQRAAGERFRLKHPKSAIAVQNQFAGAPGFEPGNGGIKIRCLTTWLRPKARADHTGASGAGQRLGAAGKGGTGAPDSRRVTRAAGRDASAATRLAQRSQPLGRPLRHRSYGHPAMRPDRPQPLRVTVSAETG